MALSTVLGHGTILKDKEGFADYHGTIPFNHGERVCMMRKNDFDLLVRGKTFVPDKSEQMHYRVIEEFNPKGVAMHREEDREEKRYFLDGYWYHFNGALWVRFEPSKI